MSAHQRHIGIVACSAEGAALCYRTICADGEAALGPYGHPEVSTHTHCLAEYMAFIERDDWDGVAELVLSSASKLAAAGADFLICPDNTIHRVFDTMRPKSPLPWLHIAEVVSDEAATRGFGKVGLTGTRWLTESSVYPSKLEERGISCVIPNEEVRCEINGIIFDELVRGEQHPRSVAYLQSAIGQLKEAGCDAVILGCTEIPLVIDDSNSPLPILDSTRLLARAAVTHALRPV